MHLRLKSIPVALLFGVVAIAGTTVPQEPRVVGATQQDGLPICDSDAFVDMAGRFRIAHDSAEEMGLNRNFERRSQYSDFMRERGLLTFAQTFSTAVHLFHHPMHDCQRLIIAPGPEMSRWDYGPLVAIFVNGNEARKRTQPGAVVAELYNHTPNLDYPILGIENGRQMYCLWMQWTTNNVHRGVLIRPPHNPNGPDCHGVAPDPTRDVELKVTRRIATANASEFHRRARAGARDPQLRSPYPATGRWQWVETRRPGRFGEQVIGTGCGLAWCEISTDFDAVAVDSAFADPDSIPGWFDEQYLAVMRRPHVPELPPLRPSSLFGRFEPGPASRKVLVPGAHGRAGTMTLREGDTSARNTYREKFTIHGTLVDEASEDPIFVRRVGAEGYEAWTHRSGWNNAVALTPRVKTPHSGVGTVRWRWDEHRDERGWLACLDGCCTYSEDDA